MKAFFFTLLYQPLYNFLIWVTWLIPGHSIMASIIILTVIIRLILLPTSLKATRLQIRNMEMQPKINKIRSEIKDQKEQSQALMDLYKEEGISPLGSCLPTIVQLGVLIVLLQVFRNGLTSVNTTDLYSFIPHDVILSNFLFGLDMTKINAWIMPIIAGLLQFGLSWMMMPPQPKSASGSDPVSMMSRQMVFLMPLMTVFIGLKMPAGLLVYWIVTTLFSLVQQWYVNEEFKIARAKSAASAEVKAAPKQTKSEKTEKPKKTRDDMMIGIMNKRLDKQEKKSGVNVTVRSKKKK